LASSLLKQGDSAARVEEWKTKVSEKGVGTGAKWEVHLVDGRKLKGFVSEIHDEGSTLVDLKTDEAYEIEFAEIEKLKGVRSKARTIGLAVATGVGAFFLFWVVLMAAMDGD
jgi:hypothetical protein